MDVTVNQQAEGKTFDFLPESEIKTEELVTFEFNSPRQLIITETKEFSAVCPFSGLPDIAYLKIEYYPVDNKAVELKSLKYYMNSFRNVGIYQEGATKRIYDDFLKVLFTDLDSVMYPTVEDYPLRVTTIYNTRGGFDTTCIEGKLDV